MSEKVKGTVSLIASMVLLVSVVVSGWVFFSYNEARAYRRVTGKQVTTWDAMFLRLRVQEPVDH